MATRFGGIWPAMLTPTTPDGKPSLAVCEQLVDLFARQQLGGIYLVGSTGQWPLFTLEERKTIAECVVKGAAGRIPVMVHVGAMTTADAIALARHAASIGADAVSAVGPVYYSQTAEGVLNYYREVGRATDLPLFAYHLSSVNQMSLGPREFASRLLEVPNIAGMKITDRDLFPFGLIHALAGDRLQLFSGADEVMCHAVLSGAIGAIGTFYNLWGPACRKAREATAAGNVASGREFMLRFQAALDDVIRPGGVWSFLHAAMRLNYGIDIGMPRPPLGATDRGWTDEEVAKLIERVDGPGA
jgi:N-acetylneuraminate lyase